MIPVSEVPGVIRSIETESRGWARGLGSVSNGDRVSAGEDERALEGMVVMVAPRCECT